MSVDLYYNFSSVPDRKSDNAFSISIIKRYYDFFTKIIDKKNRSTQEKGIVPILFLISYYCFHPFLFLFNLLFNSFFDLPNAWDKNTTLCEIEDSKNRVLNIATKNEEIILNARKAMIANFLRYTLFQNDYVFLFGNKVSSGGLSERSFDGHSSFYGVLLQGIAKLEGIENVKEIKDAMAKEYFLSFCELCNIFSVLVAICVLNEKKSLLEELAKQEISKRLTDLADKICDPNNKAFANFAFEKSDFKGVIFPVLSPDHVKEYVVDFYAVHRAKEGDDESLVGIPFTKEFIGCVFRKNMIIGFTEGDDSKEPSPKDKKAIKLKDRCFVEEPININHLMSFGDFLQDGFRNGFVLLDNRNFLDSGNGRGASASGAGTKEEEMQKQMQMFQDKMGSGNKDMDIKKQKKPVNIPLSLEDLEDEDVKARQENAIEEKVSPIDLNNDIEGADVAPDSVNILDNIDFDDEKDIGVGGLEKKDDLSVDMSKRDDVRQDVKAEDIETEDISESDASNIVNFSDVTDTRSEPALSKNDLKDTIKSI